MSYRIVIADDEALICMDLKEMLEERGHVVVAEAAGGGAGVGAGGRLTECRRWKRCAENDPIWFFWM